MADKPLEDKNKINNPQAPDAGVATVPASKVDFSQAHVGAYNPNLTAQNWEKEKKPWNASPQGRLAIRLFSRGVMGAAFFTAGGLLNQKWMAGYDPKSKVANPLQFIAKLIDTGVGKPIEVTVKGITGSEKAAFNATRFRPTNPTYKGLGRTLGDETVAVTFDFFCASIGDAWGRDIAGFIDPNAKHKWIKNGHIDVPETVKTALKTAWRYVSYNGGEDWAVAIPYCYYMKGQRAILNKFHPGFAYDSDRNLNGGSTKVDDHRRPIGNYNGVGIFDLQNRFVVYNMGTLAYRELYDYVGRKIHGKPAVLYGAADEAPPQGLGAKMASVFKWMARSVIKAGIYMTPAVPFFWITRTPQTKYRGLLINPEKGFVGYGQDAAPSAVTADINQSRIGDQPLSFISHDTATHQYTRHPSPTTAGSIDSLPYDPYHQRFGVANAALNKVGKFNNSVMNAAQPIADRVSASGKLDWAKRGLGVNDFTGFKNTYVNAAFAYTPYMYAKYEFANLWDNGKMDVATERMIDGASHLNWSEFKAGAGEVWRTFLHKPLKDPARQAIADHRLHLDKSPPDGIKQDTANGNGNGNDNHDVQEAQAERPWRERVVQGEKPEVGANSPKTHTEREEMREALKNMQPPTPSIN
jgi:hypothetical protein